MKKLLKKAYSALRLTFGQLTNSLRKTPDFIIIGVQKGGTTSMFKYLSEHPSIQLPWKKQIHFYDLNFSKGMAWYKGHFPMIKNSTEYKTGESSPYYVFHPHAAKRIAESLPNVKLIVLLRNPVTRAFSHYNMVKRHENGVSFSDAIAKEPDRLKGELEKFSNDSEYSSFAHQTYSYLSRGAYEDQLAEWYQYFKPEQILVVKSETFFSRPQDVLNEVHQFIGVEDYQYQNLKKVWQKGKYRKLDKDLRVQLLKHFAPMNEKLYKRLGKNFEWEQELK